MKRKRVRSSWTLARRILLSSVKHPANREHRARAVFRVLGYQAWKRLAPRPLLAELEGGIQLKLFPSSSSASNVVYFNGWFDYEETHFLTRFLRPGDEFWDVGANIGYFTVLAASLVGTSGVVRAFEPHPPTVAMLRENIGINHCSQVVVHPTALGECTGSVLLTADMDVSNRIVDVYAGATVEVSVAPGDEIAADARPTFIKIDAEGSEMKVIRGLERLIQRMRPVLQIEVIEHLLRKGGSSVDELRQWAHHNDYLFFQPKGGLLSVPFAGQLNGNVLLVAAERVREVESRLVSAPAPLEKLGFLRRLRMQQAW